MQPSTGHTVKAFDADVDELRALISQMGGLAEQAIRESMRCLMQRDRDGARAVVEEDRTLDALDAEAERKVMQLIALRAPMADDLREAVAVLKIAGVLERIGDYAKNIAKRAAALEGAGRTEPRSLLPEMARVVAEMVHNVLDAFVARDAAKALQVWERDAVVDDFYNSIFRSLLTFMMESPQNITESAHLLFVARNLERIGDHATNIAEMVFFAATGERLVDRPRGASPSE
jgi:phosphate transport system protein